MFLIILKTKTRWSFQRIRGSDKGKCNAASYHNSQVHCWMFVIFIEPVGILGTFAWRCRARQRRIFVDSEIKGGHAKRSSPSALALTQNCMFNLFTGTNYAKYDNYIIPGASHHSLESTIPSSLFLARPLTQFRFRQCAGKCVICPSK